MNTNNFLLSRHNSHLTLLNNGEYLVISMIKNIQSLCEEFYPNYLNHSFIFKLDKRKEYYWIFTVNYEM